MSEVELLDRIFKFPISIHFYPLYLLSMTGVKFIVQALLLIAFLGSSYSQAQEGTLKGKVVDPNNRPISGVNIRVANTSMATTSDERGDFELSLPGGKTYLFLFSHATHVSTQLPLEIKPGFTYSRRIKMLEITLEESVITDERDPTDLDDPLQMQLLPIDTEELIKMPSFNRSIEAVMKTMPGVASNNEFSSQYRVRGGNFDENLVYVNGIEIYRPFLTRAGRQEGLGFSNPDMAQEVKFSTGGFSAQYGDKLSSVLDITYRTPREFRATAELGLITVNLHVQGRSKGKVRQSEMGVSTTTPGKFTYSIGARRFSTAYLLNSLETAGEYQPNFMDLQGMFTYTPKYQEREPLIKEKKNGKLDTVYFANEPLKWTSFFAVTRNRFSFEPTGRETTFGTIQQAFRLRVGFAGQEVSAYTTGLGALMLTHRPNLRWRWDYIVTAFQTQENELIDVEGGYLLGEVNTQFGSEEFNESDFDLGIGSEIRHARNYLRANVLSSQIKGQWNIGGKSKHQLAMGIKYERQETEDDLKEYLGRDSAAFLVNNASVFDVEEYIRGTSQLQANLFKGYLQHTWKISPTKTLVSGARIFYHDLIDSWMFSPRFQFVQDYSQKPGGPDLRLRLAGGVYYQAPFYREFRRFDGSLNLDIEPQRAVHAIAGLDHQFRAWGRPFKLFAEAYYKRLFNLIPYEIQNIRIRYYPDEVADGYAYGLDMRLNGEFIEGVDSWLSLGILKTEEDVLGDTQGAIPRPTDQRVSASLYFQDEFPLNPTFKVHMNYVFGSGLRFGPPREFDNRTDFGFPSYQRVDLGFSKLISFKGKEERLGRQGVESIWATLEIFNLFQRENTVSHIWISDLDQRQFAIPNHLSARLLNARVIFRFR